MNNQQITEEIKKEIKICIETNENENTTTPNLWDSVKAVIRGRFIAIQAYLKKQERNLSTPKATRKGRNEEPQDQQKEMNHKNLAVINAKETKETIAKINTAKSWLLR